MTVADWIDSSALNTTEDYVDFAKDDPLYLELKPIMDAYRADCGSKMDVITWVSHILGVNSTCLRF